MLIKPLQRYGGEGVIKVGGSDQENLNSLINYYIRAFRSYPDRKPVMVQEYLDRVKNEGDIRVLLLNGEIIGSMRRKPRRGEFRTNILSGARAYSHQLTPTEKEISLAIKNKLLEDGLHFVGIDIIGDKLVGINCVSPGGIPQINALNGVKLEAKVIDFLEYRVKQSK